MTNIRNRIWFWYAKKTKIENKVMRKRDYIVSFLLKPFQTTKYLILLHSGYGYDWQSNSWCIHNQKYSDYFFKEINYHLNKHGEITIKLNKKNDRVDVTIITKDT